MFKAIKAWRQLIHLTRDPKVWTFSQGVLKHGSHVAIVSSVHTCYVIVDEVVIPLGLWRRWRLKRHVMRLMLQKLDKNL